MINDDIIEILWRLFVQYRECMVFRCLTYVCMCRNECVVFITAWFLTSCIFCREKQIFISPEIDWYPYMQDLLNVWYLLQPGSLCSHSVSWFNIFMCVCQVLHWSTGIICWVVFKHKKLSYILSLLGPLASQSKKCYMYSHRQSLRYLLKNIYIKPRIFIMEAQSAKFELMKSWMLAFRYCPLFDMLSLQQVS